MVGWHLMEMLTIALCDPTAPLKEQTPRRVRDRLRKVSVLDHIARFEFLGNNGIEIFVVKKFIRCFREKVKALTRNNICLLRQCVLCLIPAFTPVSLTRKVAMQAYQLLLRLAIKARVLLFFTLRSRQKVVCPNVYTTSRLWNTFQRLRHFTNDKDIPTACRLFQRDLFRVSDEPTVLADLDFTELRDFQHVVSFACFTDGILTDTFTRLEFVFSQVPRQRTDRTLISRIPLFLRTFATPALEMLIRSVDTFDRRHLQVLGVIGIVRRRSTEVFQMVDLVIHRHRFATILPHLRTHLEHIVLQLLLVTQLRKKPTFLCFRRIRTVFKRLFHGLSHITLLTPNEWVGRHVILRLRSLCLPV